MPVLVLSNLSAALIDGVEEVLIEKGIMIPNEEREGQDWKARLFGEDYDTVIGVVADVLFEELHDKAECVIYRYGMKQLEEDTRIFESYRKEQTGRAEPMKEKNEVTPSRERLKERLQKVEELLATEGKEWFARFDCQSGAYKQLLDLEEERENLRDQLAEMNEEEERDDI